MNDEQMQEVLMEHKYRKHRREELKIQLMVTAVIVGSVALVIAFIWAGSGSL